jgi:CRISPR-associated protein Csb1
MAVLTLAALQAAVSGDAVAFRSVTRLQPAGGPGDKLFPPTYSVKSGLRYVIEDRRIDGQPVKTVLLDSVASQANRMELALRAAWERGELALPMLAVDFTPWDDLADLGRITVLDAPHRIADAIFRDSLLDGTAFRHSEVGRSFTEATPRAATPLFVWCPTALVFGVWDSTGPKGGLGAKYPRAIASEIVGIGAAVGAKSASRIDPLQISRQVEVYKNATASDVWTADPDLAELDPKKKPVAITKGDFRPSTINHGNVAPSIDTEAGGVTVDYALQTTVLSLPALRRLRFPQAADGSVLPADAQPRAEAAVRTALAALGLAGMVYARHEGFDLRSRCLLVPEAPFQIEMLPADGGAPVAWQLDPAAAAALVRDAAKAAAAVGIPWHAGDVLLQPAERLVDLVRRSRAKLAEAGAEAADEHGEG